MEVHTKLSQATPPRVLGFACVFQGVYQHCFVDFSDFSGIKAL